MTISDYHKVWIDSLTDGMDHYITMEFLIGSSDYVKDDMWLGRS